MNADAIAQELPRIKGRLDERGAGEIAIGKRAELLARGADFAIETTLTGNNALRLLRAAKAVGYKVTLVYVGLSSAELSMQRVLDRVRQGGHPVPFTAIERRYPDSLIKLAPAMLLADRSYVFDNSGRRRRLLVFRDRARIRYVVSDLPDWAAGSLASLLDA